MKKVYEKPMAEYVSLAAAETIATGASYYEDMDLTGPTTSIGAVENPFNKG